MQTVNNKKQGFTLIEVVLVLAIAGLIFLIVFLALPALQRSQRDTQRRNDLSRFMSQVTNYQSNTQGQLPGGTTPNTAAFQSFVGSYLTNNNQTFNDPTTGSTYVVEVRPPNVLPDDPGELYVYINQKCDPNGTNGLSGGSGNRSFAAVVYVEQGGRYCQSN